MKRPILLGLLLLISTMAMSQRLGFSAFSSYSNSNAEEDHTLLSNTVEVLDTRKETDQLIVHDGLLNNFKFSSPLDKFIQVTFFYDKNEDGIKNGDEYNLNLGAFTIQDSLDYRNSFKEGVTLAVRDGSYVIEYNDMGAVGWIPTTPETVTVDIDDATPFSEVAFGMYVDEEYRQIRTFICASALRCFEEVEYHMVALNEGYVPASGTAWLKIDERLANVQYVKEPDVVIDSNYVGWNYMLEPSQRALYYYTLTAPGIENDSMLGEEYKTVSWADDNIIDEYCLIDVLRCSYDPNDKLVVPNRPDSLGLISQPITYTIRFQNTGNDYARNIVVTDTISEHLDMSTFKLINTSHPDVFTIENDRNNERILNFRFDNIYLPDSTTNTPGSNGFIMYTIRPYADTPLETEINNTGFIYFDFNPAIVTNTTSTTLVDMYPVDNTDDLIGLSVKVYPNPSSGLVTLEDTIEDILVYDLTGKIVGHYRNKNELNLKSLTKGTYLLSLTKNGQRSLEKIVLVD